MIRFTRIRRIVLLSWAVALLPAFHALAATSATMTFDATPQGALLGGSEGKVKGGKVPKGANPSTVIELLSVTRPGSDAASGSAMGKRTSSTALIVTKVYDSTSAVLEQAEASNQFLREVTIAFPATATGKGVPTGFSAKGSKAAQPASTTAQTLVLKNAQITAIEQTRNIQQITIEYQSIEVTYSSGKTATATDDWETP